MIVSITFWNQPPLQTRNLPSFGITPLQTRKPHAGILGPPTLTRDQPAGRKKPPAESFRWKPRSFPVTFLCTNSMHLVRALAGNDHPTSMAQYTSLSIYIYMYIHCIYIYIYIHIIHHTYYTSLYIYIICTPSMNP